jgi:myo-inositol catabolism protein IolC
VHSDRRRPQPIGREHRSTEAARSSSWFFERREHSVDAAVQARSGGRDGVVCIVLGRGAGKEKVGYWLEQGAGVPGYAGFAVGGTLWWDELVRYVAGECDRVEAATQIAQNHRALIDAYSGGTHGEARTPRAA